MASITGNGSKGHHSFTLEVNEIANSQNITNNTSDVSFTFKIAAITSGYNWSGWASKIKYTITINGTTYTDSIGSYNGSSTVTLKSGTQTIQHNNDGTKTISFSFSVTDTSGASYTCGNASASGSLTLTTIPRNSTISSITGGTIGQTLTVNINRASSNYTHEVKVTYGSKTQTLSTSATTSASGTLEMSFCNQITNNTSASAIVTLLTKNGNTYVGEPVNQLVTITVPSSVVPTISSVTKSDTANLSSTYGAYVQGKSSLRVVTSSSGAYGSSISSTTVAIKSGNTIIRTLNGSDVTFPNITNTGTITVLVTVKDSRNRSATNSSTITVATYNNPQITLFRAERLNNDDTVTLKWNASITNINSANANAKSFKIYKRQKGTSSWGSAIYSSSSSYTYSSNGSTTSCDSNQAWEFKFDAQDSFTTTTTTIEVGTAFELINWGADGTSMAIGKVASNSNTLDIALDTIFGGKLTIPKNYAYGIFDGDDNKILSILANNNVVLNGSNGGLYIGYLNTPNGIDFLQGKAQIDATTGMYKVGNVNLLESGSNTNGNYIKFSDGTMIEWNTFDDNTFVIGSGYGSLYQGVKTYTFPVAFIEVPTCVQCSRAKWGSGASWGTVDGFTKTTITVRAIDVLSRASGTNTHISWFAIGKWK